MITSHVASKCNRCADTHNPCASAFENARRFGVTKHGVGVQVKRTIHLVGIDEGFFE